ncbi:uncharacterized protein [Gossypium hirsutum]|uniref:Expp1 protein n=1 Tax=Gossypium hirsutum TaxID=3635 RepID=A0ABM2ZHG4_GOSHI|nr:uncharacterized protein LOC107894958 [Gossypium hirsutum]
MEMMMVIMMMLMMMMIGSMADDTNDVYSPCDDAKVQKLDGFTFGVAFSKKEFFSFENVQLSPCDSRLGLATKSAQLAVFRPKLDEIFSLPSMAAISSILLKILKLFSFFLSFFLDFKLKAGGYMVAFAGRKYAARSLPIMVADDKNTITSFTLVLEFKQGTLQNLFWKSSGCDSCSGESATCLNNQDCARPTSKCGQNGCNLGIQLAFSGTDKNLEALNSWYEVSKFRQNSLYGLYADLRDKLF